MSKVFRTFTTRDLIVIAGLAGIGLAIKPLVSPLSKMITSPLMIPGGSSLVDYICYGWSWLY